MGDPPVFCIEIVDIAEAAANVIQNHIENRGPV